MIFSIITPTYNSATTLPATIASVLSQQGVELEYLIIDGSSTDDTLEVIKQAAAKDARIRWISEPDEGIADAFNKGVAMATGDWIGILNSDDCYAPGVLRVVSGAVEAHPDANVIHGDMLRLDVEGRPLFVLRPAGVGKTIWHQMSLNHPTMFVSRRAYELIGKFDKNLRIAMDYDLVLRLYQNGARFVYLDQVLAHMRYGGASDERLWEGLREIWKVSVRRGYPKWKATGWMLLRGLLGILKNFLRRVGLSHIMLLHPRFKPRE